MQALIERFIRYVTIETTSNPDSPTTPSTANQWNLAHELVEELQRIGMKDVSIDEHAYIMATLPANITGKVPTIGFISHIDTSPDYTAAKVSPQLVQNYDGGAIVLNEKEGAILSPDYFEELLLYKGQTLITTNGTTLLGADDKAGIAEIVTAMDYLLKHPEIKHGAVRVAFTPDEEIGRGAHLFDVAKFGAEWAYTMDGSRIGELEYENFNAALAQVVVKGKSVHPGYAKNKMVNALRIANQFISLLPEHEVPEKTEGREGFFHVYQCSGSIERTELKMLVRDHDREQFEARKALLQEITNRLNEEHKGAVELTLTDQYYNMKEKIEPVFHVVELAEEAMRAVGVTPLVKPIRGGTDGSQLSYKGLPCPNIFAGGHNFHGKYEYVPVESMQKAVEVIVKIVELTAKRYLS